MTTHHFTQDAQDVGQFNKSHLGEQFDIVATSLGISDKAIAVGIETEVPSTKDQKHVTIAIAEGARPVDSDDIKNWHSIQAIPLRTTLDEYIVPIDPSEEKVT
ncbi:MAG: hypothetical protein LBH36_03275 [Candidatus Nomurabacteria bacterium]|nr:hypothetical protein [Candidatus Nomurabacteria bacterium]